MAVQAHTHHDGSGMRRDARGTQRKNRLIPRCIPRICGTQRKPSPFGHCIPQPRGTQRKTCSLLHCVPQTSGTEHDCCSFWRCVPQTTRQSVGRNEITARLGVASHDVSQAQLASWASRAASARISRDLPRVRDSLAQTGWSAQGFLGIRPCFEILLRLWVG